MFLISVSTLLMTLNRRRRKDMNKGSFNLKQICFFRMFDYGLTHPEQIIYESHQFIRSLLVEDAQPGA